MQAKYISSFFDYFGNPNTYTHFDNKDVSSVLLRLLKCTFTPSYLLNEVPKIIVNYIGFRAFLLSVKNMDADMENLIPDLRLKSHSLFFLCQKKDFLLN